MTENIHQALERLVDKDGLDALIKAKLAAGSLK